MSFRNWIGGIIGLAVIGLVAFVGARLIADAFSAEAQQGGSSPPFTLPPRPTIDAAIQQEKAKPPFVGELLGIFVAPSKDQVPSEFRVQPCPTAVAAVPYSAQAAGEMHLELDLPPQYRLEPNDPDTVVALCGDKVISARRFYTVQASNGLTPYVIIGRDVFRQSGYLKTPADRVRVREVGGRQAVVLEPLAIEGLPEAIYSQSAVYFPEPFGMTFIHAFELPLDDLLALGEIVAAATRR